MPWLILLVAAGVLGGAWYASKGRLGAMPDLVDDREVPRLPEGDFTAEDVRALHFARPPEGYKPLQVERLLDAVARTLDGSLSDNRVPAHEIVMARFDLVHRGYSMEQVDHVLARLAQQLGRAASAEPVETTTTEAEEASEGDAPSAQPAAQPEN